MPDDVRGQSSATRIDLDSFQLPTSHVLLTFVAQTSAGWALNIGPVKDQAGHEPRVELSVGPGGRIAALGFGTYIFRVGARHANPADFIVNISLTGDVNGDSQVTRADLKSIRSSLGKTVDSRPYLAADDVDNNGRIGMQDLRLASRDLGDSTSLRPLTASLTPQPLTPESHLVRVMARSQPGALVTLESVPKARGGGSDGPSGTDSHHRQDLRRRRDVRVYPRYTQACKAD